MSRRIFLNGSDSQNFPFFFGQPYFPTEIVNNSQIEDDEYENSQPVQSKEDTLYDADEDELESKEPRKRVNTSMDRLKIDPNYKWLLKDLNLTNDHRVIDVTDILEEKKDSDQKVEILDEEEEEVNLNQQSMLNTSKDQDTTLNQKLDELEQSKLSDEYDNEEDQHEDHKYISKLYEKLVNPNESVNKNEEFIEPVTEEESESESGVYYEWSKKHNSQESKSNEKKFSKSFEVSLESIDNIIDRVDNGIKLKKNRNVEPEEKKSEMSDQDQNKIVESLKQEWSSMFNRLENDYKVKLDEQQKLNDLKLKSLHDEIKKCMSEQEKILLKQQMSEQSETLTAQKMNTDPRSSESSSTLSKNMVDAFTSTSSEPVCTNSIVDNAKYISNLRMELKTKHTRHIQDLKDYYEKEIEELKAKVNFFKAKYGDKVDDEDEITLSPTQAENNELKTKYEQLIMVNNEYKETNESLLKNLTECNEHIKYLKNENFELVNNFGQFETKLKYSEEKIQNLEDNCSHLEMQLSDAIKLQDKYYRELQMEKRNLIKKTQENEDLLLNIKYQEQKCDNYELKLDEKDTIIARLKTKLAQMETDMNRLDFEYQKIKSSSKLSMSNVSQQPYIASSQSSQNQPMQLPIRNQSRFSSNPSLNHGSPTSNVTNSPKQQLTVVCPSSSNQNLNQQLSSSSSSSKSPVAIRSRSPSVQNQGKQNRYSLSTSNQNFVDQEQYENQLHTNNTNNNGDQQEDVLAPTSAYITYTNSNRLNYNQNRYNQQSPLTHQQLQQQQQQHQNLKLTTMSPDKQIKYIEQLESDFDQLMKQRQQLEAKLTRLPYKSTNPSMHAVREGLEDELGLVEKKLASVKLEMRKLNIIKTH